ncbi:MAG TPA: sigma-70 family RNA polymerase sigma factor, partial [Acidimicrobiales bacterium]|nr:sigma-70 family RNA polymerase sigma factor [Acidimicrobiales bacterium]
VLAATIRVTGDIGVAEECVQDAFARALVAWPKSGVPTKAGAWLTTIARRRAIDTLRRQTSQRRVMRNFIDAPESELPVDGDLPSVADDRLRLIFTCCHPALSPETQVALSLRLLCGLSTSEVARAFLVTESTMAARITRGKKKISTSNIPYRVPGTNELPARVDAVLSAIHLVFTTGHTAPSGSDLMRRDLVERALDLARLLRKLLPDDAEVAGLLALIILTDARRRTRTNSEGALLLLSEQDRSLWDRDAIAEGDALVRGALRVRPPRRFALMAAIAALHAEARSWEETKWREIVAVYDALLIEWPSPVVALNRSVAVGVVDGPEAGLAALSELTNDDQLLGYNYLASTRADFLRRLGRSDEARAAYEEALELSENYVERAFLMSRLNELGG